MSKDGGAADNKAGYPFNDSISMNQNGNDNTQIAYANNVHLQQNVTVFVANGQDDYDQDISDVDFEAEFFNLFVIDIDKFSNVGSFTIPKNESLSECVAQDLDDDILRLTDIGKGFLKTLPCLFTTKNIRRNDEWRNQEAKIGVVTKIDDNPAAAIRIEYRTFKSVPQFLINESRTRLSIEGRPRYNELDSQHWTVKKVNLLNALKEMGVTFKIIMA